MGWVTPEDGTDRFPETSVIGCYYSLRNYNAEERSFHFCGGSLKSPKLCIALLNPQSSLSLRKQVNTHAHARTHTTHTHPHTHHTHTHKIRRYQKQVMLTNKRAGIRSNLITKQSTRKNRKSVKVLVECGNAPTQLLVLFALSNTNQRFDNSDRSIGRLRSVQKNTDRPNIA